MQQADVERIIRGVISDIAAPFTLLDLERTGTGWHAMLKAATGRRVISVTLPDGPPAALRTAALRCLEAEMNSAV